MNQLNFHNNNSFKQAPPQRKMPIVIEKEKEAYSFWLKLHKNFPKVERLGLGNKIEAVFISVLELTFSSSYLAPEQKIILLGKTISRLDILKFFLQLAWENKLIPTEKYADLSSRLEEIGRMLGGWKKGLLNKTPAG